MVLGLWAGEGGLGWVGGAGARARVMRLSFGRVGGWDSAVRWGTTCLLDTCYNAMLCYAMLCCDVTGGCGEW